MLRRPVHRKVNGYSEGPKVSSQSLPALLTGARILEWSQSGSSERSGLLRIRTSELNAKIKGLQLQDKETADRNFFWLGCISWQRATWFCYSNEYRCLSHYYRQWARCNNRQNTRRKRTISGGSNGLPRFIKKIVHDEVTILTQRVFPFGALTLTNEYEITRDFGSDVS
jgi:hypothetical protein